MDYGLDPDVLVRIQQAFLDAVVQEESVEHSAPLHRDYFFIAFSKPVDIQYDEKIKNNAIDLLLSGDARISTSVNALLMQEASVELGFRWRAAIDNVKKIVLMGFGIKIVYTREKLTHRNQILNRIIEALFFSRLVFSVRELKKLFCTITKASVNRYAMYRFPAVKEIDNAILLLAKAFIQENIPPVFPAYIRPNEFAINPAYQDLSVVKESLGVNKKKIWLLRGDFILAVGHKNAYWTTFHETGLGEALAPETHCFVNWEDRYGHPSLAISSEKEDSGAFYGGLLAQRKGYLEVYNSSGRYFRDDLPLKHKEILEAYIAYLFQRSYGDQPVIFYDALSSRDYFECGFFYHDQPIPSYCPKRMYDYNALNRTFQAIKAQVVGGYGA